MGKVGHCSWLLLCSFYKSALYKKIEKVEGYDASISHLLCLFIFQHNDVNPSNMSVP